MDVSIIIVSYNSANCIRDCLASVRAQQGVDHEIIVVDNASADGTVSVLRGLGPDIHLVANEKNMGFGWACNQGFAVSRGQYVYLLNPDAQLVGSEVLACLCRELADHPRWGLAGTCILSASGQPKGPPNHEYPGQNRTSSDFSHLPGQISWVIGASMFLRRQAYEAVGGFDLNFFLYGEDTDFCLRLRQQGYEIGFVEEAKVRHIGAASERDQDPYEVATRRTNGIHLFWKKHYSPRDVARLVLREQRRARYRMVVNGVLALLQPRSSVAWQKHRRYRAICETSARFLASS